jgi:hypothetical protein
LIRSSCLDLLRGVNVGICSAELLFKFYFGECAALFGGFYRRRRPWTVDCGLMRPPAGRAIRCKSSRRHACLHCCGLYASIPGRVSPTCAISQWCDIKRGETAMISMDLGRWTGTTNEKRLAMKSDRLVFKTQSLHRQFLLLSTLSGRLFRPDKTLQ